MTDTYVNPVYPGSFPDPFVLKYGGEYYGYCTGIQPDDRCFGILRSPDLVNWKVVGGALPPLPGGHPMYWAPEVLYYNGLFYMYYSVGNETFMEIRVATAAQPGGPFQDSGRTLTSQQFAIDAHVFKDDDGSLYLFYATDFLEYSRIGTGTVMDRLLDPFTPEGKPRPVTRARYDWQVYDPNRAEKGGARWHTIEGSFVLKHRRKYYQMFSGGNWQNLSYGVSYAVTDKLDRPDEWDQVADGEKVFPVLRTIPGHVIGPGHNSVVRGPDNRQLYCVYHRWDEKGHVRQMAIDPLDWAGERLIVLGPSYQPQSFPTLPAISGFAHFQAQKPGQNQAALSDTSQARDNILHLDGSDGGAAVLNLNYRFFLLEIELKASGPKPGSYGLGLYRDEGSLFSFLIEPGNNQARLTWLVENSTREQILPLAENFNPSAYHLLRLEVRGRQLTLALDDIPAQPGPLRLAGEANALHLISQAGPAAFAGFALTPGFEDFFESELQNSGWQPENTRAQGESSPLNPAVSPTIFTRGDPLENYELVINVLLEAAGQSEGTRFYPARARDASGPELSFQREANGWTLQAGQEQPFSLPSDFEGSVHQQFRFRKQGQRMAVFWESHFLGELAVTPGPARVGLAAPVGKTIEMVRVTAL